ncbi:MAG: cupin domain-containing protein [Erythrobacter sp.]
MRINANFSEAVAMHTDTLEWVASPMPGVERRMLDRIGEEVARATSIVRYAPGSHFAEHTHDGGEEFIVLEGVFQDEHGDCPAGSYVRNPPGTHHIPASEEGCTIFVKLWQFQNGDDVQMVRDLHQIERNMPQTSSGFARVTLFENDHEKVSLERWSAGYQSEQTAKGGLEILVLDGAVCWNGQSYGKHDWLRLPDGFEAEISALDQTALLWTKRHHLIDVRAPAIVTEA